MTSRRTSVMAYLVVGLWLTGAGIALNEIDTNKKNILSYLNDNLLMSLVVIVVVVTGLIGIFAHVYYFPSESSIETIESEYQVHIYKKIVEVYNDSDDHDFKMKWIDKNILAYGDDFKNYLKLARPKIYKEYEDIMNNK